MKRLKMAIVNGNGPALVQPGYFTLFERLPLDVYHLGMAPLDHMMDTARDERIFHHECQGSLCECINLLEAIRPDILYVQDNGLYNAQVAPHIKIAIPDKPFIYEPYDTVSSIYSNPSLMTADGRSPEDVRFNVELEQYLFNVADGIVHNDDGPQVRALIEKSGVPDLHVQAYIDESEACFSLAPQHQPVRLVWAGGVAPTSAPEKTRGENKLLPFFKELVAAGFHLDVYVALARDDAQLASEYPDYLDFSQQTDLFNIYPFMPRDELIKKLSHEADYGLHIFPKPPADEGRLAMYQSSMASKVVTYLAAGLPVITGQHLEPIARYVSRHHVGVVAADGSAEQIYQAINDIDYAELKGAVMRHQSKLTVQTFIRQLETFMLNILRHKYGGDNHLEGLL